MNDGWRVIEELNGNSSDATTRQYTWGLDLAAQAGAVNSLEQAGGIGGLLALRNTSAGYGAERSAIYFYDANGNVGQVVTITAPWYGEIYAHYEYTPYGQVLLEPLFDQPYRFSTKPFDFSTGLGYWGYRHYSPKLGRWVTRDPIDEPGGLNLYMYVFNTPARLDAKGAEMYDDPEQTACCEVTDTIIYGSTRKKTKTVRCYRQGTPEGCCRCAGFGTGLLELGVRTFDRAHWGECCRCRLQVRRKDEPWIIGNWPQHVKLFVKCSNGAKWQFEFPTPPGYSDLFAGLDEGYWTTDFEDIVTDMCVSCETAEKIRKKAEQFPMDTPYSGGWTDCYWAIRHVLDVEDAVTAENCPEIQTGRSPSPGARR